MGLRILLFIMILIFSLLGYLTYLNHEILVSIFLVQGKPLSTSLSAVIIISFASGALIVFFASLVRDLRKGWRDLKGEKKAKQRENLQEEIVKGLTSLSKGDLKSAKDRLTHVVKGDPRNLDIYEQLSDIHASQGELEEAIELLEKALAIDSHHTGMLLKKARLYKRIGNLKLATDLLEQVRAIDPVDLEALMELRDLYRRQEKWPEALRLQERIAKVSKKDTDVLREKRFGLGLKYEYAQSLTNYGDDESLAKALKLCKEMIKDQKQFEPAYVLLGDIYQKQRHWAEAGKILGKGFRVSKSAVFLLRLESLYLKRDDSKTLLKIYRRILETNPDNRDISFLYSKLCLKLDMLDEAMDELVELKKRGNDLAVIHGLMAEVFARKGQLEEAVREYERSRELMTSPQLPFSCRFCQKQSFEWTALCPFCNEWNAYFQVGEERIPSDTQI
ncbi:MAG: DUF1049 domain-containing protein [Proteobacteria bacterium]|nr:DUF1049 domain-containing protein [Pseudomonadota bacterium]